jgi:hypothetical protein
MALFLSLVVDSAMGDTLENAQCITMIWWYGTPYHAKHSNILLAQLTHEVVQTVRK